MILIGGLVNWIATYIITEGAIFQTLRSKVTHKYLAYLVSCCLCAGTWVGFAEAIVFGGYFHGWYAIIANGLAYKGIGHIIYIDQKFIEWHSRWHPVPEGPFKSAYPKMEGNMQYGTGQARQAWRRTAPVSEIQTDRPGGYRLGNDR